HSVYVLVGRGGLSRGEGVEYYQGNVNQDPNAFLDLNIPMLDGRPAIGSSGAVSVVQAAVNYEIFVRATQDSALAGRIATTESQMNEYQDSWLAARIRDEATTRATQTDALSNRSASLEANYSKLSDNVNGTIFPGFERKYDGWN
ncbi:hypothetical protein VJI72_07860, partial [Parvimonas micra]|uniref:hypothetical protein n=1 Tax=Parvimonas micra TaxID=33033 RepID=UPI002B48090B